MLRRWRTRLWRSRLSLFWRRTDKLVLGCLLATGLIVAALGFALRAAFADQDRQRAFLRDTHERNLACLARNVYFEARGEPLAGQYAVAEVTINRRGTSGFPRTLCDVVYQKTWDPQRQRYVGAFSWTEFDLLPDPAGAQWRLAREVAETTYYRRRPPVLPGALFFHAVHIQPDWAQQRQRITRIGGHVFYR
jgi:spore germination cell wall hydrolase CwlJ-like protein